MADSDKPVTINVPVEKDIHHRLKITAAMYEVPLTTVVNAVLNMALPHWDQGRKGVSFANVDDAMAFENHLPAQRSDGEANT